MSSDFDDLLASIDDSFATFEEDATVLFRDNSTRAVKVIIDRKPVATRTEVDQGISPVIEFMIRNASTLGILPSELDRGVRLRCAYVMDGDTTQDFVLPKSPSGVDGGRISFRITS